jgi:type I restriction-modification system DNA methylase subunit
MLIYLFFLALYEDSRGPASRFTLEGFLKYRQTLPEAVRQPQSDYYNLTTHYLFQEQIKHEPEIKDSGMMSAYEKITLTDDFIISTVLPIFEGYTFASTGIDVIGAVFEALARRAEKDNRIGQFFTPETAVEATCLLVKPRPTDLVADPACGTARFLIHAMTEMLKLAQTVAGKTEEQAEEDIRQRQLLGVEIDPWITTIAKMNMYIHGDGKSNVRRGNGLALSTTEIFAPERTGTLNQALDVVLTNPPLGDINFRDVSLTLAREGLLGPIGNAADHAQRISALAAEWSQKNLGVVPHICNEYAAEERHRQKVEEWRGKEMDAAREGDAKAIAKAKKYRELAEAKLREVQRKIGAGELTYTPSGQVAKGGVLFLSVIKDYLKGVRDPKEYEEWKGGAVGIIMDEAVLNAPDYQRAREFIYRHFFIKAVISLPRDAFEYVAKTTAKTSILFLVKKPDPDVIQREPIFYARAESIGHTARGRLAPNDLKQINADFDAWTELIKSSYASPGPVFNQEQYVQGLAQQEGFERRFWSYPVSDARRGERLDFAYRRMLDEINRMGSTVALSETVEPVVRFPREHPTYVFATVSRKDGRVRRKGEEITTYQPSDLRVIEEGDIILSGIDVVHGSIGVVNKDCNGLVVSKEYYVLRVKEENREKVEPEFLAALLRTTKMQIIIEGLVTGTSNRTRVQDIDSFLALPLPELPPPDVQHKYAEQIKQLFSLQDQAEDVLRTVEEGVSGTF